MNLFAKKEEMEAVRIQRAMEEMEEAKRIEAEKEAAKKSNDTKRYIVNIPYQEYAGGESRPDDERYEFTSSVCSGKAETNVFIVNKIAEMYYGNRDWDEDNEGLDKKTIRKYLDTGFILGENPDKTYTRLPLVTYISKFISPLDMETDDNDNFNEIIASIYDEETETVEDDTDEPDIADCCDVTMDSGFGKSSWSSDWRRAGSDWMIK